MMEISFAPKWMRGSLTVVKAGDALTINGEVFDFTGLPDGATIPDGKVPCEWIAGPVERIGGHIHLTLFLPHGPNPSEAVAYPQPITVLADGTVAIPRDEETHYVDA